MEFKPAGANIKMLVSVGLQQIMDGIDIEFCVYTCYFTFIVYRWKYIGTYQSIKRLLQSLENDMSYIKILLLLHVTALSGIMIKVKCVK